MGCKACNTQCPIKVSIPDAKAYFLSLYFTKNFRKAQDYLIGNIEKLLLIFGRFPRIFNFVTQKRVTKFLARKIFGVTDILPISSAQCTSHNNKNGAKIYILRDAYSNYFHGLELQNAFELLTKLGFNVEFTTIFENGKALHAKGFLNQFRKVVAKNISYLSSLNGTLISIDPSVALSYRDEYPRFFDQKIEVFYLAEFLQQIEIKKTSTSSKKHHLILHCSEQTNISRIIETWREIFEKFGIKLNIIKTGCCGMSGSFGMEEQNFADSKIIFENNWQELLIKLGQDQENIIMVSGSSCKSQVERFSEVKISNPFAVLNQQI